MKLATIATSAVLAAGSTTATAQHKHIEVRDLPSTQIQAPIAGAATYQGCWSTGGNLTITPVQYVFVGTCKDVCSEKKMPVFGKNEKNCYCGTVYPPEKQKTDNSHCQTECPKDPFHGPCPTGKYFAIFNSGIDMDVPFMKDDKSSSSESSTATSASEGTAVKTAVVTQTRDSGSDNSESKKSGPNVAGIAAGVVVGVVAAGAAIGGFFFWLRRKRNAEIEEDHRRNAAVNAFISGSKPPSAGGSISMTDARLDPGLSHRRLSDGSIADNEDYSRRILRVTNA